jgi:FkbM family methyltransferase
MDFLFTLMKWNQRLKKLLPRWLLQTIRDVVESMGFLWKRSYFGQFGEDAVLQNIFRQQAWRKAMEDKAGKVKSNAGFYVDIGAFAPLQHSNTYWFYRRGWRGINVDATPGSMHIFKWLRRRDVNLELAVSSKGGELTYYCWGVPNVMNTTSKEAAEEVVRNGGQQPEKIIVKARTLEQILDEYLPKGQTIDFLTVDVENHNFEVIKSNNWSKYKPRLILVEADHDSSEFEAIAASDMTGFLKGYGYRVCAWVKPTIFFELEDISSAN